MTKPNFLKKILEERVFVKYFASSAVLSVIGLASGFFTYRFINPNLLGVFSLFSIFEVYSTFSRLGIINGLGRELPFLLGNGKCEEGEKLASAAFGYSIYSNLILLFAAPVIFYFNSSLISFQKEYLLSFIVVLLRVVFNSYTSFLAVTFRTSKSFEDLSKINYFLSLIRGFSIIFIYFFGFWGLLFREFLLSFCEMLLMHRYRPLRVDWIWDPSSLRALFKIGFPLFLVSYLNSFSDTIPRLIIAKYGDFNQLGLFSPIIIVIGLVGMFPKSLSNYLYPKMSYEFGQSGNKDFIWDLCLRNYFFSFIISIPSFLLVFFFSDYFGLFFPKYSEISEYLRVVSFGILFIGYRSGNVVFAVLKSWKTNILIALSNIVYYFVFFFIIQVYSNDILFIASLSFVLVSIFMFFTTLFFSYLALRSSLFHV
ncbi:MAG: oligosaccharide flippase family protein [Bacteroidia bacterium]|nr:oligosaccharide flippase family protein [Bacteroidia bacterium]